MALSRKYLLVVFGLIIFGLICYFCYRIFTKVQQKKGISENIQTIPNFTATQLDSTIFKANMLYDRPIIIIFFNTECEHCQYESKELAKHQNDFKNVQLLMISSENLSKIKVFIQQYNLTGFVLPLQMDTKLIVDTFGAISIPNIFIYNKSHHLVKQFKGETKIEALLKYTNQN